MSRPSTVTSETANVGGVPVGFAQGVRHGHLMAAARDGCRCSSVTPPGSPTMYWRSTPRPPSWMGSNPPPSPCGRHRHQYAAGGLDLELRGAPERHRAGPPARARRCRGSRPPPRPTPQKMVVEVARSVHSSGGVGQWKNRDAMLTPPTAKAEASTSVPPCRRGSWRSGRREPRGGSSVTSSSHSPFSVGGHRAELHLADRRSGQREYADLRG